MPILTRRVACAHSVSWQGGGRRSHDAQLKFSSNEACADTGIDCVSRKHLFNPRVYLRLNPTR
jgi:hypothetical protein